MQQDYIQKEINLGGGDACRMRIKNFYTSVSRVFVVALSRYSGAQIPSRQVALATKFLCGGE
jgi:hypothetical protein